MAKDRFLFWRSYYDALMLLDDKDAGRLVKSMCAYAFDEKESDLSDSPALRIAWTMVSGEIRESVENGRSASESGKRGGRPRKTETPPKRDPKRDPERVPKSVSRYVSTSGCAPSQEAQALAAEPQATPERTMDDETARQAALAAIEMLDRMEAMEAGGAPPGAGDG